MDTQLHILDAKREYMTRLSADIAPFIQGKFQTMYEQSLVEKKSKALFLFQRRLQQIPAWNEYEIETLATTIQNHLAIKRNAKNEYLSSLIAMAFVSYLKIMSSCRLNQQKSPPRMRLKIPSNAKFIHRCFVESARLYYDNPYTIRQTQEKQLGIIAQAVETAVRELIPLEDILDVYLQDCVDDSKTVPPILSPVQSDDDSDVDDANDDEFPMAFRPEEIQADDDQTIQVDTQEPEPSPIQTAQPIVPSNPHSTQPMAPMSQPSADGIPVAPPASMSAPTNQAHHLSEIPTAHQYRQEMMTPSTNTAPLNQQASKQQQVQNQLYNDASDDEDFH